MKEIDWKNEIKVLLTKSLKDQGNPTANIQCKHYPNKNTTPITLKHLI